MKYVPRVLLVALLLTFGVSCRHTEDATPSVTLKVITYNIHHGRGQDGRVDLERIAQLIRDQDADLVALQEVDKGTQRTDQLDIAAELAKRTDMQFVFSKNIDFQGGEYGNAILSRFPIQDWNNRHYRMLREGEQRGLLSATIEVKGRELLFASTHLDHRPDPAERVNNVEEIKQFVSRQTTPVILAGDFNDYPNRPVHSELKTVFLDAWEQAGVGDGFTISSDEPRARIDYVFLSHTNQWKVLSANVVTSDASDHLPLVVELVLKP